MFDVKFFIKIVLHCMVFGLWQYCILGATIVTSSIDAENIAKNEPALLVISYDAFRPEYFHRNVTPFMNQLAKESTRAEYMRNVFPTKTFVNHFSIATGLYPEKHGVLANSLFDEKLGQLDYGYNLFHFNNSVLPIWTVNEMQGKHSGCMMWPGTDFKYQNVSCSYTHNFNVTESWYSRIDLALSWFQQKINSANLVMVYIEEPDRHGHAFSPDSDVITDIIKKLDNYTKYIQERLTKTGLEKRVNVIYLSDHGMNTVTPPNFIDLTQFVGNDTCKFYGTSPVLQIVPSDNGKETELFEKLTIAAKTNTHFKIYNKDTILQRWHANNTQRFGPIVAVADIGYAFQDMYDEAKWYEKTFNVTLTPTTKYGVHGYDNEEESMHAVFMAKGPIFKPGQIIKPFDSINLFNLFCHVLKLKCSPSDVVTDSTWLNSFIIEQQPIGKLDNANTVVNHSGASVTLILAVIIGIAVIISGSIALYMRRKRCQQTIASRSYTLSGFDRFDDAAGDSHTNHRAI